MRGPPTGQAMTSTYQEFSKDEPRFKLDWFSTDMYLADFYIGIVLGICVTMAVSEWSAVCLSLPLFTANWCCAATFGLVSGWFACYLSLTVSPAKTHDVV